MIGIPYSITTNVTATNAVVDALAVVTISQGVAEWPLHGATAEALIAAADTALYEAKAAGRNRVVCCGTPDAEGDHDG